MEPPARMPKTGIMRKWYLMGERKRLIFIGIAAFLGFFLVKSVFFAPSPPTFQVQHTLTADEKAELTQKIKDKLVREHELEIERINAETEAQLAVLRQMVTDEMAKKETDEALITSLKQNMTSLSEATATKTTAIKEQFTSDFDGILSSELAKRQKEIIEGRADEMLMWFCEAGVDDATAATPIDDSVIDLGSHPCIGVASEGDDPISVRRYTMTSPDVARTVATQAFQSLTNRTSAEVSEFWRYYKLAEAEYSPRKEDRCCDTFTFGVHPVFGVFYKLRLPVVDKSSTDSSPAGSSSDRPIRSVCFRRKFHPRPVVKPLTPYSKIDHLLHPEQLLDKHGNRKLSIVDTVAQAAVDAPVVAPAKTAATPRSLETEADFEAGTVHVVIPFRAPRLDMFPSLIKNFGRIKQIADDRDALPFRIIVSPISWDTETSVSDAKARMEVMVEKASKALGLRITLAEPIKDEDMTKTKIVDLIKPWIDTNKNVPPIKENSDPAAAGILPNPWLAAVLGALVHVPRRRAPVLIMDSASYSLPNDLIAKTRWRVINGRMIYAPIPAAVSYPIDAGLLLSDGGVSLSDAELEEAGDDSRYKNEQWWTDVEDIAEYLDLDGPDGGRRRRRMLRPNDVARPKSGVAGPKRRLLAEDEGAEADAGDEEAFNDDYGPYDQYGDQYDSYLEDIAGDDYQEEWENTAPGYEEAEDGYNLGGYEFGDTDEPHAYLGWEEYAYENNDYDYLYSETDTQVLSNRVTTLGATKSDISGMVFRMLESSSSSDERVATPQADNCILRRMLSVARSNKYRIARTVVAGLYVDASDFSLGTGDPEVYPCECEYYTTARHCRLVLSRTEVDDPYDSTRVNCVLTSMLAKAHADAGISKAAEGDGGDINVAQLVKVQHAVRFFKPSKGIEIIAKVTKADSEASSARALADAKAIGPEVFAFQWKLSSSIRMRDDVPQ